MRTDRGRPSPPCELRALHAAATEAGRHVASPFTRLRGRWQELFDVLVEWSNCWPRPMPTAGEWAELVAAMRAARADEALARAAVG